jgi:hypothetical protein
MSVYRKNNLLDRYTSDSNSICYRRSADGGATYGDETCLPSPGSLRFGLTAAYDERTGAFLVAEATDFGRLRVHTIPSTGSGLALQVTDLNYFSWHAPSIACGINGADNCIITWEDKSTNGCLTWAPAHVDTTDPTVTRFGRFAVSTIALQQCYLQWDTPSVAYNQEDDSFRLAYGSGNYAAYSYTMPAVGGTSWTGTGDIWNSFNSYISMPVLSTERFCFFATDAGGIGFPVAPISM